jgi:hypothetical protein
MSLNRWPALIALVAFLFSGGLGAVAPMTLCDAPAGDAHLATVADDCCQSTPPLEPTTLSAGEDPCCLDLTATPDAPAKSSPPPSLDVLQPIAGVVVAAVVYPSLPPHHRLLDDPPSGRAGAIVMRC